MSDYKLRFKPITTAKKEPEKVQIRDTFETPRYATELLLPFIPKEIKYIWECAAGGGLMANVLRGGGFTVIETDIRTRKGVVYNNFVKDECICLGDCIITNPPFSIKEQFIEKAFEYRVPFAFLINADYSQQQIDWIERGCEKIIPNRRIDFLTPNIVKRINDKLGTEYSTREEIPQQILAKFSSSQSHTMWLTYGFGLGKTETFVDLPIEWKKTKVL